MNRIAYIGLIVLFPLSSAYAELVQCNGIWQNRPCGSPVSIKADRGDKASSDGEYELKRSLLVEFQSYKSALKKTTGATLYSTAVDETCLNSFSSVKDCRDIIARYESRLEKLASLKSSERHSADIDKQVPEDSVTKNVVVVNEYRDFSRNLLLRRRRPYLNQHRPIARVPSIPSSPVVTAPSHTLGDQLRSR